MPTKGLENISIFSLLFDLWKLIRFKRKSQLICLLMLMITSSFSEVFTLVTVIPFLQVLINPDSILEITKIKGFLDFFGIYEPNQFLMPITYLFITAAILASLVRLINLFFNNRLAALIGSDLSCEAFKINLYKPYKEHISTNSSSMISTATKEVTLTVDVIRSLLNFISSILIVIGLIAGLIFINWKIALLSISIFGITYYLIALFAKKNLIRNSKSIIRMNTAQIKALQEGLGSIRDVLLHNSQETYLEIFQKADRPMRLKEAQNASIASFPKYILEALGIVIISLVAYILSKDNDSNAEIIGLLGTLALCSQRILPSMQLAYNSWAFLNGSFAALQKVIKILKKSFYIDINSRTNHKLSFDKSITFDNISFKYEDETPLILKKINLEIKKGEKIGIVGETGCGKSTFLDIFMGLLEPTSGLIYIDNVCLNSNNYSEKINSWRDKIAHVPQNIYLSDCSIAENIAFGLRYEEIDFEKIKKVAIKSNIARFVEKRSLTYQSKIGERGISLSGGQIQRIAIARALYKDAEILIFDEATSALDNVTEKKIISEIQNISKELTIIMVAHRLSSLEGCDRIIKFNKGKIVI